MHICEECERDNHRDCDGTTFIDVFESSMFGYSKIYEVECDCDEHGCAVRGID